MISRRAFLTTAGASVVIAGVGAGIWARGPGEAVARAPWKTAGQSFGDPRLDALAYAILAPNPHNRQPWLFELRGQSEIWVRCQLDRRLPHTDPFDRQITIGFGCMLELLSMASANLGYRAEIDAFPQGAGARSLDDRPIARVTLTADKTVERDALSDHILARRSLKDPFDVSRDVSEEAVATVLAAVRGGHNVDASIDPARVERLRKICFDGFVAEYVTDETRRESIDLMRIGNRAIAKNPDGIDMGGLPMGLLNMAGIVTPESLDRPGTTAFEQGIEMYRDIIHSAMGFVWIHAADDARLGQIEAGRDWVRMNLAAQSIGLGIHPLSQVLQEFPEMADHYQTARQELGAEGDDVIHMLGRLGYAMFTPASPRWPLESRLVVESA
ncbi:MAG: twin-arginine translocation pathway signal protein [Pseudomonadota bacterium]